MLILLPPSEGKATPRRGRALELDDLAFPELTDARRTVLEALIGVARGPLDDALSVLELPATMADEVTRDAHLDTAHTARADRVYTGVLYEALDLASLDAAARRRAGRSVLITSALFGLLRPGDRIPAYRLSGAVSLPGLPGRGGVAAMWRTRLGAVLDGRDGLLVDLRSTTYAGFWRPGVADRRRVVGVRVLQEIDGRRSVVSHFNKATKGRLVRSILESGQTARTRPGFIDLLGDLGWRVEDTGTHVDVIVTTV